MKRTIITSTTMSVDRLMAVACARLCYEEKGVEVVFLTDCHLKNGFHGEHVVKIGWPSQHPGKNFSRFRNGCERPEMIRGNYPLEVIRRLEIGDSPRKAELMELVGGRHMPGLRKTARKLVETYHRKRHRAVHLMTKELVKNMKIIEKRGAKLIG